ncbi:unnamed protein product [Lactuca virosa]|uniref:Uncharacterized protein n=1 Tax=Lactuca virosa TaxID=75947 RepID=A0AAU9M9B0_9ASTR|nr:unnamed protein product [Lactuca virosa]
MNSRGKARQSSSSQKHKAIQGGSSQDIPFFSQDFQNTNYQQYQNYQNYQQNQNYQQQYFSVQQSYNTFRLPEENQSNNPWNQFSQRVPETQFESSQPENFQFRDAQNIESDSSSDNPAPERNEQTNEELQPVAEKKTQLYTPPEAKELGRTRRVSFG